MDLYKNKTIRLQEWPYKVWSDLYCVFTQSYPQKMWITNRTYYKAYNGSWIILRSVILIC